MISKDGMKTYSSVKTLSNIFDIRIYTTVGDGQIYIANSPSVRDQFMRFDVSNFESIGGHYMHINKEEVACIVGVDEI